MVLGLLLHLLIRTRHRPPTPTPSVTAARLFGVFLLGTHDRRSPVQRLQGQGDTMRLIWEQLRDLEPRFASVNPHVKLSPDRRTAACDGRSSDETFRHGKVQ